ncbi:hypothetical protein, partial [Puniceibacterium confluentis]|uniref:hypothetical protein n=1 Tax=Puniceibacterium confluentis TaxID=1958944 RepID=UPI00356358B4
MRADGFIQIILHFSGQVAVLHQDRRPQICLIEPGGRDAATAGKNGTARGCAQRQPPRRSCIEKRRHRKPRLRRLALRKGASDRRLANEAGGQDRCRGRSQELASFHADLS